jgi:hypothetical protein
MENELLARAVAGYGPRVGICMVIVRRARLRAPQEALQAHSPYLGLPNP